MKKLLGGGYILCAKSVQLSRYDMDGLGFCGDFAAG
jgi:hypothetical protein